MHIIFGHASLWQLPFMKLLRYLNFKVFYLHIESKNKFEKDKIANKLKENNFFPISFEQEKKIPDEASNFSIATDPDEVSYKKSLELVPDYNLEKYCRLFSIKERKKKKIRIMIQQFLSIENRECSAILFCWSVIHPLKKIVYISFKFKSFYNANKNNIYKIIIPLDFIIFSKKIIKKILLVFIKKKNTDKKNKVFKDNNLNKFYDKTIAFIPHKGLIFGSDTYKILEKSLYYSSNANSPLYKYNILHLDYSDYSSPDKDLCWISFNQLKVKKIKILLKVLMNSLKTLHLIKSWNTFLGWLFYIHTFYQYNIYFEAIKKFRNLKIALIDYDAFCPKPLILALENNNIKTVATQERPITSFFKSHTSVMLDTYYTASEHFSNIIKKSKYYDIENIISVGQYRTDYFKLYKNEDSTPRLIIDAKKNYKKLITIFGYEAREHWFESSICSVLNWRAQISFLKDCIKLSQKLDDTYIVLRFKGLDWLNNAYFKKILDEINDCENISISDDYNEPNYSYRLCVNSDLIIARHTSIADECLSMGIPVLFHEYTHNAKKIVLNFENYLPKELICENFEELLEKSKILLFENSSNLKNKISNLNKTVYLAEENRNIKDIIIKKLENLINEKR